MTKKSGIGSFVCGALCAALVMGLGAPALAAGVSKTISVLTGVNIYVDDVKLNPTDAKGEPVEVFVHNGTTYLPVRAVSQALGENVTWDSESNSVFVGEHAATGAPAGSLYELDYFSSENLATGRTDCLVRETVEDNLGAAHDTTRFRGWSGSEDTTVTYKLNGRYSRLTGVYFLPFSDRDTTTTYAAALYADGEQVWSGSVTGGVEPISIDVDLTGVQELKLVMHQNAVYAPSIYYYFGDLTLFA